MNIRALCITEDLDRPTAEIFIGLFKSGVDISVSCPPQSTNRQRLIDAGIRLVDIRFSGKFDRVGTQKLRSFLVENRIDILHLFSNKALQNGLRAARDLDIKIIAYRGIVGNVSFLSPISWMRFLNPRIDKIICVCNAIRDYFLQMRPAFLRMPSTRPVTIYKGHSLDWYTAKPANLEEVGIPEDAFTIVCVANYRPRKGIEYLVNAIAMLDESMNAHLLLIGNMNSEKLDRVISNSGVASRIHRLGFRADAPALTAACDLFVLPSTKREGLARSLIEAMAYGATPVVTHCGGSPEIVLNEQCGLVVPTRDSVALAQACSRLYADPQLRQQFGVAARQRIKTAFRIEDTIETTLSVYKNLVANRGDI